MRISLGPFDLDRPIGRGGMGEVWSAVHREHGVRVAIKLLTVASAARPTMLRALREEVRAIAGLEHPRIIVVLDQGVVSEDAAAISAGVRPDSPLVAGSPYLAMELVEGATLTATAGRLSWVGVRSVLVGLLDALAHAHARGVIHRDLKPGNVLLPRRGDRLAPKGLKLTDFGIAHCLDQEFTGDGASSGTPGYMPPEQLDDRWRDFGPWTDLYALGCLAWWMVCGQVPGRAHFESPPATWTLRHRITVPEGLGSWLARLLEPEPEARFQRAADAHWELLQLGEPTIPPVSMVRSSSPDAATTRSPALPQRCARPAHPGAAVLPPPLPESWRRVRSPPPARALLGAGLGLYGLRSLPFIGREPERDRLWALLREVRVPGPPRVAVLQGTAGSGKSRLAEWLGVRAQEVGAATVLKASHGPGGGPLDGLGPMLARAMRCGGLSRSAVEQRVQAALERLGERDAHEVRALTELVSPASPSDRAQGRAVQLAAPAERRALVLRHLLRMAAACPVVLWLDDVQWASEAMALTRHLIDVSPPTRVLVVLTARDEALAERPEEQAQMEAVLASRHATRMALGQLAPAEHSRLVRELLHLDADLAERVDERTAGNPMFAVQLVGDWVHRRLLEVGPTGFRLVAGATPDLPDDLHAVWAGRVARLLIDRRPADRRALEIAATLGPHVDTAEWLEACACADVDADLALPESMLQQRLARSGEGGPAVSWSFTHGMLHESIGRMAREAGRDGAHHRACATMLSRRKGPGTAERRGRHLVAGDRTADALQPLLDGARERAATTGLRHAEALLGERDAAMDALDLADDAPERCRSWLLRGRLASQAGAHEAGIAWAERTEAVARRRSAEAPLFAWLLVRALQLRGTLLRRTGDMDRAVLLFDEAVRLARVEGDADGLAKALLSRADLGRGMGDVEGSSPWLREALALSEALGDDDQAGCCWRSLGEAAMIRGRPDEAVDAYARALMLLRRAGSRASIASLRNVQGEVERVGGDLAAAEVSYTESIALYRSIGSAHADVPSVNLALLWLEGGDATRARDALVTLLAASRGQRTLCAVIHTNLLACRAALLDFDGMAQDLASAAALLAETGMIDVDVARTAHRAADLAAGPRPDLARDAYALALGQWRALGRTVDAEAARAAWASLDPPHP
jgi:serine/threonine protein kinase/tetratricopeptide (TPR) repeat protein